jgi:hypothetical protein
MQKFQASQGLHNAPEYPATLQWSEDGVIAVAGGNCVTLLNPGDLPGPRAFVALGDGCDVGVINAPGEPAVSTPDLHNEINSLRAASLQSDSHSLKVEPALRGAAWSPPGAEPAGGCLLAGVTTDQRVRDPAPTCRRG